MSHSLGNSMPESLGEMLEIGVDHRRNSVIFILTSDDNGFPHVALLSPYQVVTSKNSLFLSMGSSSTSCSNILKRGKATLVIQPMPSIIYLKTVLTRIEGVLIHRGDMEDYLFSGTPSEILEDVSDTAPFTSSLKFGDDIVKHAYGAQFHQIRDELRNLGF